MKKTALIMMMSIAPLFAVGCDDDDNGFSSHVPLTPQGVYTVTGDQAVYVYWNGVYDTDVQEYIIFRSFDPVNNFSEIGTVQAEANPNLDLLNYEYIDDAVTNGTTYYYAVASVDHEGHVSDLSAENAYDTPRPQGQVSIFPKEIDSTHAGFNLETQFVMAWNNPVADVYVDQFLGTTYINVEDAQTDIMDMGYTSSFDEINVSPSVSADTGWSALGYYEVVPGHTYVIWTRDNHFAKMRVLSINQSGSVSFQWAYQTDTGNPELAPAQNPPKRPVHSPDFLRKAAQSVALR